MSNEEFYMVNGDKITREYLVQLMIDEFNKKYSNADITDFNEGSVIRNILESLGADIYHLEYNDNLLLREAFLATATGGYLDLHGEEYGITRGIALQAQGTVTFSIAETEPDEPRINYKITIPQYTRIVDTATGLYYETWTTVEIPVGETSVNCPVYSVVTGAGTNIPANSDFLFYDQNSFKEVTISNDADFTGGCDAESDTDYRARLIEAKTSDGFGSREYYTKLGRVKGTHDIALVDSATHTAKVIVNGYDTPISDTLLALVTSQYTNEKNLVYNHSFEVVKAEFTTVPLEITIGVTDEISEDTLKTILNNYITGGILNINSQQFNNKGVSINSKLTNYELMTFIETINGVVQVTSLTSDDEQFSKLEPETNKVLRWGTISITQNIVE